MALLKKTNELWEPSEKPDLKIGESIEVTNFENLVKTGMAVLVDENGNEIELPGQEFKCPICFINTKGVAEFTSHVSTHLTKNRQAMEDKILAQKVAERIAKETTEPVATESSLEAKEAVKSEEPKKLTRAEILAKARAARKAK